MIKEHEVKLQAAIEANDFFKLDEVLQNCQGVDIDVKMKKNAEVLHLKLQHELKISTFLKEKHHHDNYKDIRKDIKRIEDMVSDAENLKIDLDAELSKQVNEFT